MTSDQATRDRTRPDLLDAEEEIELSRRIETGLAARAVLDGVWTPAVACDPAELGELDRLGRAAAARYVEANLALVGLVLREQGRRAGEPDLFQEGCLGLIEAVRRFDHRRGCRFATYALHWVRAAVREAAARAQSGPGLSGQQAAGLRRVRGLGARLEQELGRSPSVAELAERLGRSVDWTRRVVEHREPAPVDLGAVQLADRRAERDLEAALLGTMPGAELLDALPPLVRAVLRLRYGFGVDGAVHTSAGTAELLGLGTAQVRRLEREGLDLLRGLCPAQARLHLAG